jgi:hypothetical protein
VAALDESGKIMTDGPLFIWLHSGKSSKCSQNTPDFRNELQTQGLPNLNEDFVLCAFQYFDPLKRTE